MRSKCGKDKEGAHELQAKCFYHILRQMSSMIYYWADPLLHEIYLFYTVKREEKTTHILALYLLTVQGFVLSLVPNAIFCLDLLLLFFFILLVYIFSKKFFNVSTFSKQNNRKNILQNCESLVAMTHDGNCCKDFLQFRHSQVVKNSFCLLFCISLLYNLSVPAQLFSRLSLA